MKLIQKLERKFGRYAVPNLIGFIVGLYAIGYLVYLIGGSQVYYGFFSWNVDAVLQGQVWRLVTFLLKPPTTNPIMILLICYIYWNMGRMLEQMIGTFGFNLYMISGVLFHILGGLIVYWINGTNLDIGTTYLNLSMFLAITFLIPDMQFYLYGLIPIKAKWMAALEIALYGYLLLTGDLSTRIEIIFSLMNAILFFFMTRNLSRYSPSQIRRRRTYQKQSKVIKMTPYRHKCAVCGRTEADGDQLEFRYCSKCAGNYEYCMEHLYTHIHVTDPGSKMSGAPGEDAAEKKSED